MNPNKLACEHGHQRGKCVYCDNAELLRENAELRAAIATPEVYAGVVNDVLEKERDRLADMLRTARKALEWYGDRTRYEHGLYLDRCGKPMAGREIMYDHGERAREALKGVGNES